MPKQLIPSAIFLKGFSSVIVQTLLIRELFIVFCGNELTFGITLSIWLASAAIGGAGLGSLFKSSRSPLRLFCLFQLLLSLGFPLAIIFVRVSRLFLGISFAGVLGLNHIIVISLLCLSLVALSDGALFAIGFRLIPSVAKIYILESCGVIIGAVAFTFILLTHLDSFSIALLVSVLNISCCCLLLSSEREKVLKWGSWILLGASLFSFSQSEHLEQWSLSKQWQKKNIIRYQNSTYGNIAVFKEAGQTTLFYDGLPALSIPDPEAYVTEDLIGLPLLSRPDAKKVFFAGTAAAGLLTEALKYPLSEITYAETDPLLIKVLHDLREPVIERELNDPRVHIQLTDARNYIKKTNNRFDVIFINTPLPTSLSINRYYTSEFLKEIRRVLNKDGLVVFKTWGSLAYLSPQLLAVNASLYKTLAGEFPCLEVIPGDGYNIFLASAEKINLNPSFLSANLTALKLKTPLFNPGYIHLRLLPSYHDWFYTSLKDSFPQAPLNQDLKPAGLYEGLSLYYAQFSKKIPQAFAGFKKIKPVYLGSFILFFFGFWQLFLRKNATSPVLALKLCVSTTGFFAISTQIIVFFLFQSFLGYLFQWLALLTMSFMAGTSLGALTAYKKRKTAAGYKKLALIEIALALTSSFLTLATILFFGHHAGSPWMFSLISLSAGFLVGIEVPLAFELGRSQQLAGQLYGLDLAGACLGALAAPLVLIPSCGILATTALLCLLKCATGGILALLKETYR